MHLYPSGRFTQVPGPQMLVAPVAHLSISEGDRAKQRLWQGSGQTKAVEQCGKGVGVGGSKDPRKPRSTSTFIVWPM